MITDDPIADLERQLLRMSAELAAQVRSRRRRRRRLTVAAGPAAALVAVAVAVVVLLGGEAASPSIVTAAAAQLSPGSGVMHLVLDSSSYDDGRRYQHVRVETWYSPTRQRTVSTSIGPTSGRRAHILEVVRTPQRIVSYESGAKTLTSQTTCTPSGLASSALDPIALLDALRDGKQIRAAGETTFDGRRVARLVGVIHQLRLVYLVSPKTGVPVALTTRPAKLPASPSGAFTGTVVRFRTHEQLGRGQSARRLLAMPAHPQARVIKLGRRSCGTR